jgi:hypothetical protein
MPFLAIINELNSFGTQELSLELYLQVVANSQVGDIGA